MTHTDTELARITELKTVALEMAAASLDRAPMLPEGVTWDALSRQNPLTWLVLYCGLGTPIRTKITRPEQEGTSFPIFFDMETGLELLVPAHTVLLQELSRFGASREHPLELSVTCFGKPLSRDYYRWRVTLLRSVAERQLQLQALPDAPQDITTAFDELGGDTLALPTPRRRR